MPQVISRYPSLLQINSRVRLTELSRKLERRATLADLPERELDRIAALGFEWVWLLSVWQTGEAGKRVSRGNPEWRKEFQETLTDLREEDIGGSGFAITKYRVADSIGGDDALAVLRQRLAQRGVRLMLDFVPNHTALDHPWVESHPEHFIDGTEEDLARAPQNYTRLKSKKGSLILAHGRDPYFPGWPDTLQLNYANPATQEAMAQELITLSERCDGVRCDMAMLLLPDVFQRTWGRAAAPFWPKAIQRVREKSPQFCFMAEVYWDLEWTLQQQGFNYAYDKRLYDRLREGHAAPVRDHLRAGLDYQDKLARFLENHDEPRAAATFAPDIHRAAATVTYCSPGMRFFHDGQVQGRRKRVSPHLIRGPQETIDHELERFYDKLFAVLRQPAIRNGQWQLLECVSAWEGNWTHDCFIASAWQENAQLAAIVVVNYAAHQSQCYVRLPFPQLGDHSWQLADQLGYKHLECAGAELVEHGLFVDMGPWQTHVFTLRGSTS